MVVRERLVGPVVGLCLLMPAAVGRAEIIGWDSATIPIVPGGDAPGIVRLADNSTPLFGYSLDVQIVPQPGAVGSITVDTMATGFHDPENLITAGGSTRDPLFSVILAQLDGVFISTNTFDGGTVTATPGVNDALALLVFVASSDALGDFEILLGSGSALSDASGFAAPFTYQSLTIQVVPEPSVFLISGLLVTSRRQRAMQQ